MINRNNSGCSYITVCLCLFCRELEKKFDLFYYDGLANQDEEIRLTVGEKLTV